MRNREQFRVLVRNGTLGILAEVGFVAGLMAVGAAIAILAGWGGR